jgi:hypothetical protein
MKSEFTLSTFMTTLKTLNDINGADKVCEEYEKKILEQFKDNLIGVLMGIPYGGDVERLAKIWGEKGKIYGYDTFEGHPKELAKDPKSFEATCMENWYKQYGTEKTKYEYQRAEFDKMGFADVVILRKGIVTKNSCKDLPYINYAFMDMDILKSMVDGFEAVADKMVSGGYLLMHDIDNLPNLKLWWETEVLKDKRFEEVEPIRALTGILRKK